MDNMKNLKGLVALVLALSLTMTLVGAALADGTPTNYAVDDPAHSYGGDTQSDNKFAGAVDGHLYIRGLEENDEVKFYKVIGVNPDASAKITDTLTETKAAGWEVVSPFNTGANAITVDEFKAILTTGITDVVAGKIGKNATGTADYTATANASGVAEVATPVAGLYVAIVTPANAGWMFNPVFVAADYYTTTGGDKSSDWTVDVDLSYSNNAMAKKVPITVTKTAEEANEATNEADAAKAVGVGDVINYTISTTIPEFADNYLTPIFIVSDTLSNGLTLDQNSIAVKIGENTIDADNYVLTKSEHAFKVAFKSTYLLGLSEATAITVTYSATVTESAVTNVNEEDNTVTVEYSHNPSVDQEGKGKKVGDKTHHYTFTIDGTIWGDSQHRTIEVVKVGVDKDGNEITMTTTEISSIQVGALAGAEFKLYTNEACTTEYNKGAYANATAATHGGKIVSDAKGNLNINGSTGISGLDAGVYYLKETYAPDGYIKKQAATKIEIKTTGYYSATWTEGTGLNAISITSDDLLKGYEVYIDNVKTATYELNYAHVDATGKPTDDTMQTSGTNMKTATITIGNKGPITSTPADMNDEDDDGKIVNTRGVELPSTGGIGTTIFYIVGVVMVLGAAAVMVARRKSEQE